LSQHERLTLFRSSPPPTEITMGAVTCIALRLTPLRIQERPSSSSGCIMGRNAIPKLKGLKEHPTSGCDRQSTRRCWELLDITSRSFSAVIKELDGDLARTVSCSVLEIPPGAMQHTANERRGKEPALKSASLRVFSRFTVARMVWQNTCPSSLI